MSITARPNERPNGSTASTIVDRVHGHALRPDERILSDRRP